jgi:hypothetical protein
MEISFHIADFNMKKLLWLLPISILGLVAGLGYFLWERATAVPDWYSETGDEMATLPTPSPTPLIPSTSPTASANPLLPSMPFGSSTPISTAKAMASPASTISTMPKALPVGVRSLRTQVKQDELRSGALVDLAEMETSSPSKQTALVQKLLVVMPQLRGQKIFLGVRGQIVEQNGQRQLAADSKLSIGKVELPLDEVAVQMSLTRADLDRMILSYLQLNKPTTKAP